MFGRGMFREGNFKADVCRVRYCPVSLPEDAAIGSGKQNIRVIGRREVHQFFPILFVIE